MCAEKERVHDFTFNKWFECTEECGGMVYSDVGNLTNMTKHMVEKCVEDNCAHEIIDVNATNTTQEIDRKFVDCIYNSSYCYFC